MAGGDAVGAEELARVEVHAEHDRHHGHGFALGPGRRRGLETREGVGTTDSIKTPRNNTDST